MRGNLVQGAAGDAQGVGGVVGRDEARPAQPELRAATWRVGGNQIEGHLLREEIVVEDEVAAAGALETHHLPVVEKPNVAGGRGHNHVFRARFAVANDAEAGQQPRRVDGTAGEGPLSAHAPAAVHRGLPPLGV